MTDLCWNCCDNGIETEAFGCFAIGWDGEMLGYVGREEEACDGIITYAMLCAPCARARGWEPQRDHTPAPPVEHSETES